MWTAEQGRAEMSTGIPGREQEFVIWQVTVIGQGKRYRSAIPSLFVITAAGSSSVIRTPHDRRPATRETGGRPMGDWWPGKLGQAPPQARLGCCIRPLSRCKQQVKPEWRIGAMTI